GHLGHTGESGEAHRADELVLEDLQHAYAASDATRGQAPTLQPSKRNHISPERDRLEDVAAALNPAIQDDLSSAAHRLDDLGQRLEAAETVIDLASTVIRHPDVFDSVLDRQLGVF